LFLDFGTSARPVWRRFWVWRRLQILREVTHWFNWFLNICLYKSNHSHR
jgi:hypothetical protein